MNSSSRRRLSLVYCLILPQIELPRKSYSTDNSEQIQSSNNHKSIKIVVTLKDRCCGKAPSNSVSKNDRKAESVWRKWQTIKVAVVLGDDCPVAVV